VEEEHQTTWRDETYKKVPSVSRGPFLESPGKFPGLISIIANPFFNIDWW